MTWLSQMSVTGCSYNRFRESSADAKVFQRGSARPPSSGLVRKKLQKSVVKQDAGSWARIENDTVKCSPSNAKVDDNLAFTVGFRLDGVVRRNFHQKFWEAAYDQHDGGLRMAFKAELRKSRLRLLPKPLKEEKFVRRAVFFWTRNPELPHRVWMTVAKDDGIRGQEILEIEEGENEVTVILRDNRYLFVKVVDGKLITTSVPE